MLRRKKKEKTKISKLNRYFEEIGTNFA